MTGMPPTHDRRYWEQLLAAEGMPAEPKPIAKAYRLAPLPMDHTRVFLRGRLHELVVRVHQRRADASTYYDLATEYLWRGCDWTAYPKRHRVIWEMHCQGASQYEIAARLRYSRRLVGMAVRRHGKLMRGADHGR